MKAPEFESRVVGMHFRERDGIPAKAIVANFVPPVRLTLEREPDNQFDAYAIKVFYDNQHIGYVEAGTACFLSPWLDEGHEYTCTVTDLIEQKNNLYPAIRLEPA